MYINTLQRQFKKFLKCNTRYFSEKTTSTPRWKVLFFGTDKFSLSSLKSLHDAYRNGQIVQQLEIVTTHSNKANEVQKYGEKKKLTIHKWPPNIPDNFYDVGVVVSFGHLIPEDIIKKFKFGMLNVHASLLPRWRGAAPIIYAIANGDTETGVTIMNIKPKKFDIGEIIMQKSVKISENTKMNDLHEILAELGASCLLETLGDLKNKLKNAKEQPQVGVTLAPKVTQSFATIDWKKMTARDICNLERAVYGLYFLNSTWNNQTVKLQNVSLCEHKPTVKFNANELKPGYFIYDKKDSSIKVLCADDNWISIKRIGIYGKKIMSARDFNNGYLKEIRLENKIFQ